MADNKKEVQTPFDLGEKITMYAPMKALNKNVVLHHEPGEKVSIHPNQKKKFTTLGYTETAPVAAAPAENTGTGKQGEPGIMTTTGTK